VARAAPVTLDGIPRTRLPFFDPPETPEDLWWAVWWMWDVKIPTTRVCPNHVAPFDAFAAAYFATSPVIVVKASRGLAGKTFSMAHLTLTETVFLGAEVTLLGGSLEQSSLAHDYAKAAWDAPGAPVHLLDGDPTQRETRLVNDGHIRVLAASTKSARGRHPQRMRLDEVDEMDRFVFESALGQPMAKRGIASQTLIGSTHHYPNGTFTYILEDLAPEKGWPVMEWCYRESRSGQ